MKTLKLIVVTLFIGSIGLTSCNKETDGEPKSMKVRMTDAPGDFAKLEVEIASVEAYNEKKGWIMLENETQMVSVLDLTNGAEIDLVSETKVKSGVYTKLRLTFGDRNKIWVNTEALVGTDFISAEFDLVLNMPDNQYEIIIDQEIDNKTGADILLDFNVAESITGSVFTAFTMEPLITVIKDENTGVSGSIEGSKNTAVVAKGNGETYSTYADKNGKFLIRGMLAGTYEVTFMPTEDDLAAETTMEVVVKDGEVYSMGTVEITN